MDIGREFPFKIDLSPERSREGNSEGQQDLYHFEDACPLLFRQDMFNILLYERRMIHRELHNKGNLKREFSTG